MSTGRMIIVETKEFEKLIIRLKGLPIQMVSGVQSALNRSMQSTKSHINEFLQKEYNLVKPKDTYRTWPLPSSNDPLEAGIGISGRLLSFARFSFGPSIPSRDPVKVRIKAGGNFKEVRSFPRPFVAPTGTLNHEKIRFNVFRRLGPERNPIAVLRTLSVPQMISNDRVAQAIQEYAMQKLGERIEHEISWRLDKIKKR